MKKSLIALAVLAAAGAASAQSSVTLSGIFKTGIGQTRHTNGPAAVNGSTTAVADGSSRFIISGQEDLGGGLKAVFQVDNRFRVDDNGPAPTSSPLATGNTFVGLAGGFGQIRVGKLDTHYCLGGDTHGSMATALQAGSCALLGYLGGQGRVATTTGRSVNLIRYDLPTLVPGLTAQLNYSTEWTGNDGNMGDAGKGRMISGQVGYASGPFTIATSVWNSRSENRTIAVARRDQQSWIVAGSWNFGIARVGLTFDQATHDDAAAGSAVYVESRRRAWSIPVTARVGSGTVLFTYTRADDVRVGGATAAGTGARLWSVGYDHALSKRTSVGVSYANLNNDAGANYQLYTANSLVNLPSLAAAANNGTDQRQFYVGVRHTF